MDLSAHGLRVHLADVEFGDAEAIVANGNDMDISHNTPTIPHPYTIDSALTFIEYAKQRRLSGEEYHMGVRMGDALIGMCVLSGIDNLNKRAEIGYWIGKAHWGKGYASEAVRLMLSFGFTKLELNKISAKVLTYNERSIKLLERLGFSKEGMLKEETFHGGVFLDEQLFAITKTEFKDLVEVRVLDQP